MARYHILLIFIFTLQKSYCVNEGYYWLDFNGTVPEEALVGGYDSNGDDIYIGSAEVKGEGTLVGPIFPDVPYIQVPFDTNIVQINSSIKILCGEEQPLDWIRANSENLHVVLIDKNPIVGGTIKRGNYGGNVHIGRISLDNGIKIGSVMSFEIDNAKLLFVHKNKVLRTSMFEVLLYNAPRTRHRGRPGRRGPHRRGH